MVTNPQYGFHHIPNWQWTVAAGAHPGFTLWSVLGGSGSLQVGTQVYPLRKGYVFLLNYREAVVGTEHSEDSLEVRFLDFETEHPEQLEGLPVYRYFPQHVFFGALFDRVSDAQDRGDREALRFWSEALLLEYRNRPEGVFLSPYAQAIEEICTAFAQHPEQSFDVRQLGQRLGLTPDHFIRIFKREKEITPYAYLTRTRLEAAKSLLLKSSLSVNEIATAIGYSDLYGFSRFFKAKTGFSPLQYRAFFPGDV